MVYMDRDLCYRVIICHCGDAFCISPQIITAVVTMQLSRGIQDKVRGQKLKCTWPDTRLKVKTFQTASSLPEQEIKFDLCFQFHLLVCLHINVKQSTSKDMIQSTPIDPRTTRFFGVKLGSIGYHVGQFTAKCHGSCAPRTVIASVTSEEISSAWLNTS